MTAEEQQTSEGQHSIPMEGEDITPKKDGGVLKVKFTLHCSSLIATTPAFHAGSVAVCHWPIPGYASTAQGGG